MSGEKSRFSDKTKLLFVTYGYAISSGLINRAKNIVLDEVHEAAEDISLTRAILHERKVKEPDLRLLEMSATVNAERQAGYWKDVGETSVHSVAGQALVCEERRQTPNKDSKTLAQTTFDLLENENRNGVAVFCSGIKDVENTAEEIRQLVRGKKVEVVQIYGGSPKDERDKARATPREGWKKVIVGTNVIESGVNLRWVDAGISDGYGKIPYDRPDTGAYALVQENLPQWRIVQQRGRVNRDPQGTGFDSGIFVLHSNTELQGRPDQATPELERRSLANIAFHAASLGYQPETLHFDAKIAPQRWQEAKDDLIRLGLIDADWQLTKDGKYIARLPLSPETGAMLCEAQRMDIAVARSGDTTRKKEPKLLPEAIIVAAIAELGSLREDGRRPHGMDGKSDIHGGSDLLDGLKAYLKLENTPAATIVADGEELIAQGKILTVEKARENLKEQCAQLNVSYTGFCDTMLLVGEIRARHKDKKAIETEPHAFDPSRYDALKRVILNGSVNQLFQLEGVNEKGATYRDLLRDYDRRRNNKGEPFGGYPLAKYSTLKDSQATSLTPFIVGKLKELPNKNANDPGVVIDQATSIPASVFIAWAAEHEPQIIDKVTGQNEFSARYAGRGSFTVPLKRLDLAISEKLEELKQNDNWQSDSQRKDSWSR